jgi:hypothetical protein
VSSVAEILEGIPVQERTTPASEVPGPRGSGVPTWRAPQVPGRAPTRQRVPVVAKEVRSGALARAIAAREAELQRGGRYHPVPEGLRDHAGRPVHLPASFQAWDEAEADQEHAQHEAFTRSIRDNGTRYLEDRNHELQEAHIGIDGTLEDLIGRLRQLRPALPSWRDIGQLGDVGRYRAEDYARLLDAVVAEAERLYTRTANHRTRVESLATQRQRGGYAVMHELIDQYPALVSAMLPLKPPTNPQKPRGHWHDLNPDHHDSRMLTLQELINDCEEVRGRLHARDALRNRHAPADAENHPALRSRQR